MAARIYAVRCFCYCYCCFEYSYPWMHVWHSLVHFFVYIFRFICEQNTRLDVSFPANIPHRLPVDRRKKLDHIAHWIRSCRHLEVVALEAAHGCVRCTRTPVRVYNSNANSTFSMSRSVFPSDVLQIPFGFSHQIRRFTFWDCEIIMYGEAEDSTSRMQHVTSQLTSFTFPILPFKLPHIESMVCRLRLILCARLSFTPCTLITHSRTIVCVGTYH